MVKISFIGRLKWLNFCKYFCGKSDYLDNNFYCALLSRYTVAIDTTEKPEFSFKFYNTAWIMPSFGEIFILNHFTWWFKDE